VPEPPGHGGPDVPRVQSSSCPQEALGVSCSNVDRLGTESYPGVRGLGLDSAVYCNADSTPGCYFQENVSFDHYFGTYPIAANPGGEPRFVAKPGTPNVNGFTNALLNNNPNLNPANGDGATNPFRLDRTQSVTADQDHDYTAEQQAFDAGLLDLFPKYVGTPGPPPAGGGILDTTGLNLGYFDGNTVTGLWNYAQKFAMSDNSFSTTFGPSTPV
jgi:phospholipase C